MMHLLQNLKKSLRYQKHCCGCIQYYGKNNLLEVSSKQINSDRLGKARFSTYHSLHQEPRVNYANIQMISASLHKQIFKEKYKENLDEKTLCTVKEHLENHKLWGRPANIVEDIDLNLTLHGNNIAEHFQIIAEHGSKHYFNLAEGMASILNKIPAKPEKWHLVPGWTKYYEDGSYHSVSAPQEDVLVFDVEVCLSAGKFPVIATALSKDAWYCWVSTCLCNDVEIPEEISVDMMIPIDHGENKLVIGHNVSYDRSFTKGEYELEGSNVRFLDTLSLHMCISGVTNEQRNYLNSKNPPIHYDWMDVGTTNSLAKVYEFYCDKQLDKSTRDFFVEGTLEEIRENFQECVQYCSSDVSATKEVFQLIWPMFLSHAPHHVTFAGMLEMGSCYLPVNKSWNDYIDSCENMFDNVTAEMKQSLMLVAEDALKHFVDQSYKEDPWLWSLDWSVHKCVSKNEEIFRSEMHSSHDKSDVHAYINGSIQHLSDKRMNQLQMPGYPKWYRDLCMHKKDDNYKPGPRNISSQTKVTPSLLRMTWDGYPLHHEKGYGWGYLVPKSDRPGSYDFIKRQGGSKPEKDDIMTQIYSDPIPKKKGIDIGIPGVTFYRLPHKDGEEFNVGNPLAKDFLGKIEDGTLASSGGYNAKQTIEMNKMLAFWRNGRKRIRSQHTVWSKDKNGVKYGAILPHVITAGTVTRRAVEPTWLTASNPRPDRIGSELKSLVQAPEGYCLVGADVDSQELWIASILGDSQFAQMHGSTALSWMTLQGNKSDRTDLHSRTADTIGMSRDQAKIFNYGRIYGAGEKFAVRLLMQFNHQLSAAEAEEKAEKLYQTTKGFKKYKLTSEGMKLASELGLNVPSNRMVHYDVFKKVMYQSGYTWETRSDIVDLNKAWFGGSESEMFNKLESIALSDEPRTPVLQCLITNALSPKYVKEHYKTSRVNWVVQSSAVDYLHLMLTCMRWLIEKYKIDARFCISVHDEVRYIVREEDKYRAALALQISNLLTRSMFSYKLKLYDLPQSVAFFSSVDIDEVWRKEVDFDCVTPSNSEGLKKSRNINPGESLNISELLKKMGNDLNHRSL